MVIADELLALLESSQAALAPDVVAHIRELIQNGEAGVAFEELCSYLFEVSAPVPGSSSRLAAMARQLGTDPSYWKPLVDLQDETLR